MTLATALALLGCLSTACSGGSEPPSPDSASGLNAAARRDRRLILIGLDAADERMISAGIRSGALPNFERMVRDGASGPLRTFRPILSPILWTTMATGLTPDRHGVLDFLSTDAKGRTVPVTRDARKAPAFWNILGERGVSCGIVGWLATYPAERVNGFIVSDRFATNPLERASSERTIDPSGRTFPPELFAALRGAVVDPSMIRDADLASVFGAPAGPSADDAPERRELRVIEAEARTYAGVALRLGAEKGPDLLAVYFEAIDRLMHLFGDVMPPPMPTAAASRAARYGRACERFYAAMDERLGRFLSEAERGSVPATVIVVSDHGFKLGAERPRHPALRGDVYAAEWHRDPGVVLAWGKGVRKGVRVEGATIYDVAPTVLGFFGVAASEEMKGRVLASLFEPGFLPAAPPRVPAYTTTAGSDGTVSAGGASADEDREVLERLKALGYVGGAGGNDPAIRASANLATFYLEEKQYDRAMQIYKDVLAKDPSNLIALFNLGFAYKGLGAHAKAAEAFERLLKERPDYMEARLILSDCYASIGRGEEALRLLLERASDGREDPGYQNHLGTVLATARRFDEAKAALERAIELRPDEASPYLNLARVLMERGDRAGAIGVLRRAERHAPGDPRVASRLREMREPR